MANGTNPAHHLFVKKVLLEYSKHLYTLSMAAFSQQWQKLLFQRTSKA
jgi:hypothetical protein